MNQLQAVITRIFRLEKPIDKRLLWLAAAGLAVLAFVVFSSLNDGSSGATVASNTGFSGNTGLSGNAGFSGQGAPANSQSKTNAASSSGYSAQAPKIYVHVVGSVVHPGLYILQSGARIADAIFAADGFARGADQASVNLARVLSDGEQIVVLKIGSNAGFAGGSSSLGSGKASGNGHAVLINLNRSTETEIESLPGVGPTLAGRIIDFRIANGGFKSKSDLQKVAGIGDKLFAALKDLVTL